MPELPQIDRLIAEVAARHGILLKKDDAAFALVTLNQLVLESAISDFIARTRAVTAEFEAAMGKVQERAGAAIAKEVGRLALNRAEQFSPLAAFSSRIQAKTPRFWCVAGGFIGGFALGVVLCRMLGV